MSTGETLSQLSSLVLNLISIYLFTSRTCKNSHVEVLFYFSYGKIKSRKSPWVKKTKETGPKKKEKAPFCQAKENNLAESDKALGLAKRLRQARHLLKIRSVRKPFWHGFCLCLYLWRLCPLLRGRPELNCTERYIYKKNEFWRNTPTLSEIIGYLGM